MSQRLYTFLLFLPNCRSRAPSRSGLVIRLVSFQHDCDRYSQFAPVSFRSSACTVAGTRQFDETRTVHGNAQRGYGARATPLVLCSREAPRECAPRCIQTMFVPFASRALPLSWAPFVYSRPLFRHPSRRSNNTLDSSFTRSLSLSLARFRCVTTFQLPFSFHPRRHERVFFLCAYPRARNGSSCLYTMASATISRYRLPSRQETLNIPQVSRGRRCPFFLLLGCGSWLSSHPG